MNKLLKRFRMFFENFVQSIEQLEFYFIILAYEKYSDVRRGVDSYFSTGK